MLRTSMRNVVRTTVRVVVVLVGREIGSVTASEPLPNFQKLAASSLDGVVVLGQGK